MLVSFAAAVAGHRGLGTRSVVCAAPSAPHPTCRVAPVRRRGGNAAGARCQTRARHAVARRRQRSGRKGAHSGGRMAPLLTRPCAVPTARGKYANLNARGSVLLLVNSIVIGIIICALRGIYYALLEEGAIPVALTGMATGLISMLAYTPDVFVPALAGHLLDRYSAGGVGYRYLFLILAMFSVAGVGLTLLFRHRISGRPARVSNSLIAEVHS